jgi:hypothetical protein
MRRRPQRMPRHPGWQVHRRDHRWGSVRNDPTVSRRGSRRSSTHRCQSRIDDVRDEERVGKRRSSLKPIHGLSAAGPGSLYSLMSRPLQTRDPSYRPGGCHSCRTERTARGREWRGRLEWQNSSPSESLFGRSRLTPGSDATGNTSNHASIHGQTEIAGGLIALTCLKVRRRAAHAPCYPMRPVGDFR